MLEMSKYFTTDAFMSLASMERLAASRMMEEGLAELLKDLPKRETGK